LLRELEPRAVPSFVAPKAFDVGTYPDFLAVGDINGDGISDLVVANEFTNDVSVLLGNGDGSFQAPRSYYAGILPSSVVVADVNGDGLPDLAVAGRGGVRVLLGNGDDSFQTTTFSYVAGNDPSSVAVGEFNDDGWPDLVTANSVSNDVSVLLNDAAWPGGGAPTGTVNFTCDGGSPQAPAERGPRPGSPSTAPAPCTLTGMSAPVTALVLSGPAAAGALGFDQTPPAGTGPDPTGVPLNTQAGGEAGLGSADFRPAIFGEGSGQITDFLGWMSLTETSAEGGNPDVFAQRI
jgi:hypothetical protein